jgi:hypothetical protein
LLVFDAAWSVIDIGTNLAAREYACLREITLVSARRDERGESPGFVQEKQVAPVRTRFACERE